MGLVFRLSPESRPQACPPGQARKSPTRASILQTRSGPVYFDRYLAEDAGGVQEAASLSDEVLENVFRQDYKNFFLVMNRDIESPSRHM
jgi:hypothetical protein